MAGNGITTFSGKWQPRISPDGTDGRYTEIVYSPIDLAGQFRAVTTSGIIAANLAEDIYFSTGDGSSTSNIGGLAPATAKSLDFTMRVPANFETAATSYVDIYYFLTGSGTKGDAVQWNGAYNTASVNATTKALATSVTTTNITNSTRRVLATSKANGYLYKDTITIAPSTFTADTLPQFRITAYGTYTQPELRMTRVVHRYARAFL